MLMVDAPVCISWAPPIVLPQLVALWCPMMQHLVAAQCSALAKRRMHGLTLQASRHP